ncbi:uncharacterized protein LOC129928353 [Biomphalaria glabrata]|uniref:Uncharacterized protein LOC129928353 n=1 Tax=Biomphalaria glabrata TaxID=6526 RepID=A0A9W3BGB4_BIOGL|nr:uncharacterized protein LOC129928353 [Biomphalaria glabrata]
MLLQVFPVLLLCLHNGLAAGEKLSRNEQEVTYRELRKVAETLEEFKDQPEDAELDRKRKDLLETLQTAASIFCKVVNAFKREITEEMQTEKRDFNSLLLDAKAVCQAATDGQGLLNAAQTFCSSDNVGKRETQSLNDLTDAHQVNRRGFLDVLLENAARIFCSVVNNFRRDLANFQEQSDEAESGR